MKKDLCSLTLEELTGWMKEEMGQPAYRARQLFQWLHEKQAESFSQMTNLPGELREKLENTAAAQPVKVKMRLESSQDGTRKFLYQLRDGNLVEGVWMEYRHGPSLCISTQVGCRMGCVFCASTLGGKVRDLTPGEMLGEVYEAQRQMGRRISSLVLMGIGEPLDNYDNVVKFLRLLSSPQGQNLSLRHVSLSTCGLVDRIRDLAKLRLGLTLSVSLHAPDDRVRSGLMPVNKRWDTAQLISACKDYFDATGRRISFEYALMDQINDSPQQAEQLGLLLRGLNCHVNLIPLNPVREREALGRSRPDAVALFATRLAQMGVNVTVRRELGQDIAAACGQLRRQQGVKLEEDDPRRVDEDWYDGTEEPGEP